MISNKLCVSLTKRSVITCLSLMVCGMSSAAEPRWSSKVKPFAKSEFPEIRPITLNYSMSWNGTINSGRVTMVLGKEHKNAKSLFLMQAYGRSTGVAGAAFPYSFVYNSFTRKGTNQPIVFISQETDRNEVTHVKNTHHIDKVKHTRVDKTLAGKVTKKREHEFRHRNLHDPLSAMLYLRGQPLKNGDVVHLALHPFRSPQYAKVTVLGREEHRGFPCIKLDLKIENIDKKTKQLEPYKKLKKATLWISDDLDRILVELRSKVFIGDVRMVLTERAR